VIETTHSLDLRDDRKGLEAGREALPEYVQRSLLGGASTFGTIQILVECGSQLSLHYKINKNPK
jgi:hypothetical protein